MEKGACYILSKNFRSPVIYHEKDLDLEILYKGNNTFSVNVVVYYTLRQLSPFYVYTYAWPIKKCIYMHDLIPDFGISSYSGVKYATHR